MNEMVVRQELLNATLSLAVPLWIERLKKCDRSELVMRARACGQVIAEKGDIIQFKSKRKGETAAAFSRLAEGLACLALVCGEIECFGQRFLRPEK